jgi:hypothetical protein
MIAVSAAAEVPGFGSEPPPTELRLDLGQLYTLDDLTGRHVSFSELRGTVDAHRTIGGARLELHLDGRGRLGWSDITSHGGDIARAYASFGSSDRKWLLSIGRQTIDPVDAAAVDGVAAELSLGSALRTVVFGGMAPHPISAAFDDDFLTVGAGYEVGGKTVQSSGGAFARWYQGTLDRFAVNDRVYWRLGEAFMIHAHAVAELAPKIDLSQASLMFRFRPSDLIDVSLYGAHHHALLPNKWWQDYLEQERARRGFVLDGAEPIGSRRSIGRAVIDLHLSRLVTPYVVGRTDYRHEDSAKAYEGTIGLKLDDPELGYADLSATARDLFGTENELGTIALGTSFADHVGLELNVAALRTRMTEGQATMLYDLGGTMWLDLAAIHPSLGDVRLLAAYQAFIDPEMIFQVWFLRVGYRFRDG